ncbi:MAG: ATP-binding protein [Caulobacteraceae bacterium]
METDEYQSRDDEKDLLYITLSSIGDGVITADMQEKIMFMNDAAEQLTGFSKEEAVGCHLNSVFKVTSKEKAEVTDKPFKRALESGKSVGLRKNSILTTKKGEERYISASNAPIKGKNGETIGVVVVFRDITMIRKAEQELQRAKDAAEAANKAKSEFLANMSHEIRTPLNGIIGMTDLTLLTELTPEQRENLTIVKSCARALLSVINDILDFSKIEAGKMSIEKINFDIREIFENTIKPHFARAQEKGLKLEYGMDKDIPKVLRGDPVRLQQVLNNLISNAIKFTELGSISLYAGIESRDEKSIKLKFSVSDTGIGIDDNEIGRLFKSFSQVDGSISRKYGGTGLGLVISKRLTELMGGAIWVESSKGRGSTFYFTCMLENGGDCEAVEKTESYCPNSGLHHKLDILLVEDDEASRIAISRMIKDIGHNVWLADNGEEALDILDREEFDAVFMDIQMPVIDGFEATKRIREWEKGTGKHTFIVAVTAFALQGDREKCINSGMDDYISKPISAKELQFALDKFLSCGFEAKSEVKEERSKLSISDMPLYLEKLEEALSKKDTAAIEHYAHQIKLLSYEASFEEIRKYSFKAELAARRKSFSEIENYYALIKENLRRIISTE